MIITLCYALLSLYKLVPNPEQPLRIPMCKDLFDCRDENKWNCWLHLSNIPNIQLLMHSYQVCTQNASPDVVMFVIEMLRSTALMTVIVSVVAKHCCRVCFISHSTGFDLIKEFYTTNCRACLFITLLSLIKKLYTFCMYVFTRAWLDMKSWHS